MKNKREKHIGDYIEQNFSYLFPDLILLKREYYIPQMGYADFYGIHKTNKKVFIIELKTFSNNPNQQLISYRWRLKSLLNIDEENIILIGINENFNKNIAIEDIIYYEFQKNGELVLRSKIIKE